MSLDRREFHKLTLAAVSGLMAGASGCGKPAVNDAAPERGPVTGSPDVPTPAGASLAETEQLLIDEPHVCRGLNACKGLGAGGENACAGQGACATLAKHDCAAMNDCKGQGGCGENPGSNSCKGKGGCHVPLMDDAWTKARKGFEEAMKKSGKTIGEAPAKA